MNTLQAKTSIKPLELQRLLAEGAPAQLLDVRTPGEFAAAHMPGAKLIPLDDLNPDAFQRQRGSEEILVYVLCQSGGRVRKAIEKLEQGGVHGCVLVEGGTQAWIDAGLPTERAQSTVLPLMRQVQITVGLISAAGAALGRSATCRHRGSGLENPAQGHDHLRHSFRPASDHVVADDTIRRGCDETDRRAHDRRLGTPSLHTQRPTKTWLAGNVRIRISSAHVGQGLFGGGLGHRSLPG